MLKHKRGTIINLGSMYSYFGSGLIPSYSAAIGTIVQLTKSMAIDLAPHNIQVNAIAPGWIETDMTAPARTMPLNDEILARTPAARWGQPEKVAGTALYLASRASDNIPLTGLRLLRLVERARRYWECPFDGPGPQQRDPDQHKSRNYDDKDFGFH